MQKLTYEVFLKIAQEALKKGAELGMNPLAVVVFDERASLRICLNQDGTAIHATVLRMARQMQQCLWGWGAVH